jgi:hypothetical protein
MTKYQELSDLSDKMTRRRVNDRVQNIDGFIEKARIYRAWKKLKN